MDFRDIEKSIRRELPAHCKPSRLIHSLSAAGLAEKLCRRFAIDPQQGLIAGLVHDVMKDSPLADQWRYARKAAAEMGLPGVTSAVASMESNESFGNKIIHGPAAAGFLFDEYGLAEPAILEAVALHSSASSSMGPLAKVVYVSDKLEPCRKHITAEDARAVDVLDLDALMLYSLERVIGWLSRENHAIAQSTLDLYNALKMRAPPL